ncbi:hypothetical protein LOC68_11065 [Blastopirellula sp. JC732]|uniref:Uncharacterized protein n=1 Tax=Blastopirellula sediminis TaxID=2894196 RepID=A0A9X1MNX7_9BACT|nr:hypothetical protein [Blastopirellula sediminis]MCC9608268.1 hypothetical protein [Blastopirellula sediminis]MCC9628939.1 hypothetical protein [Blastopirellula sediminis]
MEEQGDVGSQPYLVIPRPEGQLRKLPVKFRWEVTRRHPVYLQNWKFAQFFFEWAQQGREMPTDNESSLRIQVAARSAQLLNAIGVSSFAPDPQLEFDDLEGSERLTPWLGGSISPVSLRRIWGILISAMSAEDFQDAATQITAAMSDEKDPGFRKAAGLGALRQIEEMKIDQMLNEPIVYINPEVSDRQIERDLKPMLSRWRNEKGIVVGRDRSDSYADYLRVWDLREGWEAGAYSADRERTLKEVANELEIKPSTANMRYRSAFQLVTGHPYLIPMWVRFMGIEKLSKVVQESIGKVAQHRPTKSRAKSALPESGLAGNETLGGIASEQADSQTQANTALAELIMDIESLVRSAKSNDQIREALDIDATTAVEFDQLIELVRARVEPK